MSVMPVNKFANSRRTRSRVLMGASAAAIGWAVSTAALALPGTPTIFTSSGGIGVAATFTPGPGTLIVDQNHERVVIDWTSFDVDFGESVSFVQDQANWVAFNRVDVNTFTTISGSITGAGSVWIFSPAGMLISNSANINVGSFVAGLGLLDDFQANAAVNLSGAGAAIYFDPLNPNENVLTIEPGASITGADFVVLQGANIDTAGDISSSGGVGFMVGEGSGIEFDASNPSGLVLTTLYASGSPNEHGTPFFNHTGTTTAAWVDLQFAQLFEADYQMIINLDGVITATGVTNGLLNSPADTAIVVGGINSTTGLAGGRTVLLNVLGDLNTTSGGIDLQATDIFFDAGSVVNSGTDFGVFTYGDITVQGDITSVSDLLLHSQAQNAHIVIESTATVASSGTSVDVSGNRDNALVEVFGELSAATQLRVRSKGDVYIGSTAILTGNSDDSPGNVFGVTVQAGLGFDFTAQTMTSIGAGDVVVANGALIDASGPNHPTRVFIGANYGDIDMGGTIYGSRVSIGGTGDILISGDIFATDMIRIIGENSALPLAGGGDITITGNMTADDLVLVSAPFGDILITSGASITSDADGVPTTDVFGYVFDDDVLIFAAGSVQIESGASIDAGINTLQLQAEGADTGPTLADAAMILSGDINAGSVYAYAYNGSVVVSGTVDVAYSADFYASEAFVLTSAGTINSDHTGSAFQVILGDDDYSGVFIESGDIAIAGQINSEIIAVHGLNEMVIGGVDGPANVGAYELGGEFNLSQNEFDNLNGSSIVIIGGDDSAVPELWTPVDITVLDLTIGETVDSMAIGTGSDNSINIVGVVAPQTPGGAELWLGFIKDDSGSVDGFIPGQINISGSIGTASNPFGAVNMLARYSIVMGSPDFIGIALADEDFNANLPNQIAVEEGHIFIASDVLTMASAGRIIQQNTGAEGQFAGLLIGEPQEDLELISVDPNLEGMVIGGPNGYTIEFQAGPDKVQLFGVLLGQQGHITGRDVADNPWLLSPLLADNVQYTINGCSFGGSPCGNASEVPQFETPTDVGVEDLDTTEELTAEEEEAAEEQAASEDQDSELFRSLVAPGADRAYEQERIGEPITGSGNEDLWTGRGDGVRP